MKGNMSIFCLSAFLVASLITAVTSREYTILEKSLRELTGQNRLESHDVKERPARSEQMVTCAGVSPFDLSAWVDKSLESFPLVKDQLYKDIEFSHMPDIVKAFEGLVFEMVEKSMLESYSQCIYLTWSMSYLTFELQHALLNARAVVASSISHALLHLENRAACEEVLIESNTAQNLYSKVYQPAIELQILINDFVEKSGYQESIKSIHQQVFQPVAQLVHTSDPNVLMAQEVIEKYMEGICKLLERRELYQFVDPSCDKLEQSIHEALLKQLASLKESLSLKSVETKLMAEVPEVCLEVVPIFLEESSHDDGYISLPAVILNSTLVRFNEMHDQPSQTMEILRRLMRDLNLLDVTSKIEASALISHILSSHIAIASQVPLDTPLEVLHAEELEMICLELFSQVVYTFTDSCLDYKLVAPLIGIMELKHLDMSMTNIHFLSIVEQIWSVLTAEHPTLDTQNKYILKEQFFEFVKTIFITKLQFFISNMMDDYNHVKAFWQANTVVLDTLVMVTEDMAKTGTLGDLVEDLSHIVAHSFHTDPQSTCPEHKEIYMELKSQIIHLSSEMEHISATQIEIFAMNLMYSLPPVSKLTQTSIEELTKEGLTSLASYILDDVHLLATSLHGEHHHSRMAVANFIGAHLASSLYKVIRYYTTTKTSGKPVQNPEEVNKNLEHLVMWQHQVINSFFSQYIDGLQNTVLNMALDPSMDFCKLSPSMCATKSEEGHTDGHFDHNHESHADHHEESMGVHERGIKLEQVPVERAAKMAKFVFEVDSSSGNED